MQVEGALLSKFRNAGQTCVCANRMFVHEDVYAAFRDKLVARVAALRVGDGRVPGTAVGPLISSAALDRVDQWVADAVDRGARVLTGGSRLPALGGGFFYAPTVVEAVPEDCALATDEIFGPVVRGVRGGGVGEKGSEGGEGGRSDVEGRDGVPC